MIRKEINTDGTFGGNYPEDIEYPNLPETLILITEEQRDYIDSHLETLRYDALQQGIFQNPCGVIDISQTPEYLAEQAKKEQERLAKLTMTALDFVQVLNSIGISREQRVEYLASNPDLDDQLKYCQNVYCGVVCQLCPITMGEVEITQEMVIRAFKQKNGMLV